jgi:hypothetical protein
MENQMLETGIASRQPEIMTPVYDRLSKSILKAAVLLAASRKRSAPVVVEVEDVLRAAVYGENWRMYVQDVMNNVGKGTDERLLDQVQRAVERRPGVSRSVLMQNHHLSARSATQVFDTLEQRGRITRHKNGKAETIWPVTIRLNKEGT